MSQDTFRQYLVDVHLAEQQVTGLRIKKDSARKVFRHLELALQEKYGINDSVYLAAYQYYLEEIVTFKEIYTGVVDSLSNYEKQQAEKVKAEKRKNGKKNNDQPALNKGLQRQRDPANSKPKQQQDGRG